MTTCLRDDEKQLLMTYLESYFCKGMSTLNRGWIATSELELIARTKCNQSCEYCYIHKFGDKLYPNEVSKAEYLRNTKIILDYAKENRLYIPSINIFSGDILSDHLIYEMLDIIFDYGDYLYNNCNIKNFREHGVGIILPINTYYLNNEKHKNLIEDYVKNSIKHHCKFNISISTDGLYATDVREKKNLNQEFYDDLIDFAKRINAGFHPMISAESIDTAINNFNWWTEMYKKMERKTAYPFMLHVRNDNWTPESIKKYCDLLEVMWDFRWNQFNHDKELMSQYILADTPNSICEGFDPLLLKEFVGSFGDKLGCTVQTHLFIDLSDMSIVTCHRLAYPQFKAGKFIIEDDKIVDIEPLNVVMWAAVQDFLPLLAPKCYHCDFKHLCMKGCLGSQFEHSGEAMIPIDSVCELEKARTTKLIELMNQYGVLKYILDNNMFRTEAGKLTVLNICNKKGFNINE